MNARTKYVRSVRLTPEVHDWLQAMSDQTGISMGGLMHTLLDHARLNGWTVQATTVQEGGQS